MIKFTNYCKEKQITESKIAELLKISVQSAGDKMDGKEPFTLEQVKDICTYFQISADEYFF